MGRKLKISLMTILTLILLLILTKDSFASWSPSNQTPIYPQQGTYFCKEKGGPIRFTQIKADYSEDLYNQTINANGLNHAEDQIFTYIKETLTKKMQSLADTARPIPSNSQQLKDYNGDFTQENNEIIQNENSFYGAKVAMTPVFDPAAGGKFNNGEVNDTENSRTAYIFSSGEEVSPLKFGLKKGNYAETASDKADAIAKQYALWNDPTYNEGNILNGSELYAEALAYEQFYNNNLKNGYNAKLNSDSAKVIVNMNDGTYIVGPFKVNYPDDRRFSYIEEMVIATDTGYVGAPSKVIFESASQEKIYPSSDENFFIEFSAAETGYPTKVSLGMSFGYIENTNARYERLAGQGDIYQLVGEYNKTFAYHTSIWQEDSNGNLVDVGSDYYTLTAKIHLQKAGTYRAQTAAHLLLAGRKWNRAVLKVEDSKPIDLTIELGGTVWLDELGGKESVVNGKMDDKEKRVPNITVTLYRNDGQKIADTKTDKDGNYRFKNLNAMCKYYVKFTYNGQYYQPTNYSKPSTWYNKDWNINSNATDKQKDREDFNNKFANIGSSPDNYGESKEVYTKQELINNKVIDEFGNLIIEKSSSDNKIQKMIQFVKDCMIDSYTGKGDGSYDLYPVPNIYIIDNNPVSREYKRIVNNSPDILYPNAYHINLGLNERPLADLALRKDVDNVTLEINGQTHKYTYNELENRENAEQEWDISARISDFYYNTNYTREIYKSDYIYKASSTNNIKSKDTELNVYITYKISIRNQSLTIQAKVNELVDYYDPDLEYINERSYIEIKNGDNAGIYNVGKQDETSYSQRTITNIDGYNKLYVTGLNDKYLTAGQTAYVYLTFKVKKDTINGEEWIKLDEELQTANAIGVGKENIAEINGYSTRYTQGAQIPNVGDVSYKPAGILDIDSKPGNLNPLDVPKDGTINYDNFEDDTDKAPNIKLKLYRDNDRIITGSVWEDAREIIEKNATIGNGSKDEKNKEIEKLINGVKVQLIEIMDNGEEFEWGDPEKAIRTGTENSTKTIINGTINGENLVSDYQFAEGCEGQYAFKSFIPGKYVIRFTYGDTVETVVPKTLDSRGLNEKSYNGQDYKSTTYQPNINTGKSYEWKIGGDIITINSYNKETCNQNESKTYLCDLQATQKNPNDSDAKDIASRRNTVIGYSDKNVTNSIAEVLASHKQNPVNEELLGQLIEKTQMTAETGLMVIEVEFDQDEENNTETKKAAEGTKPYEIKNIDLGLEERPKAQLTVDKKVTNAKLTLSDNSILFDAKDTATNVLWKKHKAYEPKYENNLLQEIRNNSKDKIGLVQLSMDEELMHGATMEISYSITVSNIGEVDYKDAKFYYTGKEDNEVGNIVTTTANQVIDYVANNLQFNKELNKAWEVIDINQIKDQKLVNSSLLDSDEKPLEQYNTIISTTELNTELVPELANKEKSTVSVPLVLTQLITSENDTDDLTYENIVEIVKTSNTVGRRMYDSIVGNQDPTKDPAEPDADKAEVVKILPPFGNAGVYITIAIITIAAMGIITVGIIFVKKKVLRK